MASDATSQPLPAAAGFHCLLGIISGLLLYGITSVAAVMITFLTGLGVVPILSRVFNPLPWVVLILLSNALPVALFVWCRRKARFFAFGLLGGSFGGCMLHLLYALSAIRKQLQQLRSRECSTSTFQRVRCWLLLEGNVCGFCSGV